MQHCLFVNDLIFFRLLLFDVIEDLTLADCKALKYVIQPSIPRLNKEASKDPLLMFSMMEKAQVLAQDNVDTLQKALTSIGRDDLNDKVIAYKGMQMHCLRYKNVRKKGSLL